MCLGRVVLPILLATLAVSQVDPFRALPPALTRDEIISAREKFELEKKLDTRRPWDGRDLTGPRALEIRPNPVKQ